MIFWCTIVLRIAKYDVEYDDWLILNMRLLSKLRTWILIWCLHNMVFDWSVYILLEYNVVKRLAMFCYSIKRNTQWPMREISVSYTRRISLSMKPGTAGVFAQQLCPNNSKVVRFFAGTPRWVWVFIWFKLVSSRNMTSQPTVPMFARQIRVIAGQIQIPPSYLSSPSIPGCILT